MEALTKTHIFYCKGVYVVDSGTDEKGHWFVCDCFLDGEQEKSDKLYTTDDLKRYYSECCAIEHYAYYDNN